MCAPCDAAFVLYVTADMPQELVRAGRILEGERPPSPLLLQELAPRRPPHFAVERSNSHGQMPNLSQIRPSLGDFDRSGREVGQSWTGVAQVRPRPDQLLGEFDQKKLKADARFSSRHRAWLGRAPRTRVIEAEPMVTNARGWGTFRAGGGR